MHLVGLMLWRGGFLVAEAEGLGADAIVNLRFTTSQVMTGAAEFLAYGTAVTLKH